jgi:signal peptidase I
MLIAIAVRTFIYEPFNIPSGSMIPTLLVGDYLFVSKFSYGYSRFSLPIDLGFPNGRIFWHPPQRGDVVVFKKPPQDRVDYIKRLVGLPGDHIQVKHGILYINGNPVKRRRIADFVEQDAGGDIIRAPQYIETLPNGKKHKIIEYYGDDGPEDNTQVYTVPPGHYFMMGDNRDNSEDSRYLNVVGYVPAENLIGRADIIFFSTNGSASLLEPWKWPWAIRYDRLFERIQ